MEQSYKLNRNQHLKVTKLMRLKWQWCDFQTILTQVYTGSIPFNVISQSSSFINLPRDTHLKTAKSSPITFGTHLSTFFNSGPSSQFLNPNTEFKFSTEDFFSKFHRQQVRADKRTWPVNQSDRSEILYQPGCFPTRNSWEFRPILKGWTALQAYETVSD